MKKIIQKSLITLFCVLLASVLGCTNYEDYGLKESTDGSEQSHLLVLDKVVYHTGTESYMIPQNDPYTLTNFQNAFEKLALGNSNQILTRSQTDEFLGSAKLEATHYALKIYPKNEKEQWKVELMEDVKVAYLPFDYVELPEDIVKNSTELTISEPTLYPDESRYTVTYDDLETNEGPVEPETYVMPVLYVVWPVDKPLPDDLDYEVDYEVFLPQSVTQMRGAALLSEHAMQMLENEAIQLALVSLNQTRATTINASQVRSGTAADWDTFLLNNNLGSYAPLANLKLRFQLGSSIWETTTGSDGNFNSYFAIPDEASLSFVLQHQNWKITSESSTTPMTVLLVSPIGPWWQIYNGALNVSSPNPNLVAHRAANYFYNGSHIIESSWGFEDNSIRIRASANSNSEVNGRFTYSLLNSPYITIYKNNGLNTNYQIGTVLHELGHFSHYKTRGGYLKYNSVHSLLKESFASFAGWHIGEQYYARLGYVKPSPNVDFTGQGRQDWRRTNSSVYSPLFVDLMDDYNQGASSSTYPNDAINFYPRILIRSIARESSNWSSCRRLLEEYVGIRYTITEFNNYIINFDYWFANN